MTRIPLFVALACACQKQGPPESIRVLTDRTASHLENIFAYYEEATGLRVETNFVGDGLLTRLERRPREADVVVTKNADLLELAKAKGLLGTINAQKVIDAVPKVFRDPDLRYVVLSFRARALFTSRERVAANAVRSYQDLILPRWQGRICVRSGFHEYNVSWLSQMAVVRGRAATEQYIERLAESLARPPRGNDRAQVRAVFEGACDVAVANSYYMGLMHKRDDQRAWADATRVVFPNQGEAGGTYVMRSGVALTRSTHSVFRANQLVEFLTGELAQRYFSEALFEVPVRAGVPLAPANAALGKAQGIDGGAYQVNLVKLSEAAQQRAAVFEALTRVNFDRR